MHAMHFAVSRIEWKTQKKHNNISKSNSKDLLYLPRWITIRLILISSLSHMFSLFSEWIYQTNTYDFQLPIVEKKRLGTKSKLRSKQKRRINSVDNINCIEIKRNVSTLVSAMRKKRPAEIKHKPIRGYRTFDQCIGRKSTVKCIL